MKNKKSIIQALRRICELKEVLPNQGKIYASFGFVVYWTEPLGKLLCQFSCSWYSPDRLSSFYRSIYTVCLFSNTAFTLCLKWL